MGKLLEATSLAMKERGVKGCVFALLALAILIILMICLIVINPSHSVDNAIFDYNYEFVTGTATITNVADDVDVTSAAIHATVYFKNSDEIIEDRPLTIYFDNNVSIVNLVNKLKIIPEYHIEDVKISVVSAEYVPPFFGVVLILLVILGSIFITISIAIIYVIVQCIDEINGEWWRWI